MGGLIAETPVWVCVWGGGLRMVVYSPQPPPPHSLPLPVSCCQLLWAGGGCCRLFQKLQALGLLVPCLGPQPECPPHIFSTDSLALCSQGFSSESWQGMLLSSEATCVTHRLLGVGLSADLWSMIQGLSLPGHSVTALLSLWVRLMDQRGRAKLPPHRLCPCCPRLIRK